jgi:Arc/MetJ-type ribon-helix-helix transcriptional regulator
MLPPARGWCASSVASRARGARPRERGEVSLSMYTHRSTVGAMANILSLRSDAEIAAAVDRIGDRYGNRTDMIKTAILHLAEEVRREELRAEVLQAVNDPDDVAEMRAVLAEMEQLRAW